MKMKTKYILTTFLYILVSSITFAQDDLGGKLNEAESSYASGDLSNARFQLQQALIELDREIGKEVLKVLPTSVDGKESNSINDHVFVQGAGISGLTISRNYGETTTDEGAIQFNMVNNSPMIEALSMFLANPMFMAAASGQKMVKIQGFKSVVESDTNEAGEIDSFTIQIPFGDTLISLEFDNYSDENKVIALANEFNIGDIAKLVGQ